MRDEATGNGDDERLGPWRPAAGSFLDWPRRARDVRVLDPCCGSGHFLVEAFELLVRLRTDEEGLSARDALRAVLADNLFGLEIDPRCTQIAAFNLALAAWRMAGGWFQLPPLNIASCGIAPHASEAQWVRLADDLEWLTGMAQDPNLFGAAPSLARGPLREGMAGLHRLFGQARDLGSLIDPEAARANLFRAGYDYLKNLLDAAIEDERRTGGRDERAVAAAGMARAAEILTGRYTLVVTNVPFLARGKQDAKLRKFAETHYGNAKGDIATVFASRIFRWLGAHGTQALVTPQNWLFLTTYRKLRERLLKERTWNVVARLGEHAFADAQAAGAFAALVILSAGCPRPASVMAGLDVSAPRGQRSIRAAEKAALLAGGADVLASGQAEQGGNPDSVVLMRPVGDRGLLQRVSHGHQGIASADYPAFGRLFWENSPDGETWVFQQSTVKETTDFGGREHVLHWNGVAEVAERQVLPGGRKAVRIQGGRVWNREGIAVSQIGALPVTLYTGEKFDNNSAALGPLPAEELPAVWAFCSSPEYAAAVREFDQSLKVTNAALVKVPFDLDRWTKVAAERYPNGLPEPYSDDPTQWIFHGDPCRSVIWDERDRITARGPTRFDRTVLQVAVARLLGYRWPAELDPDMRLAPEQRAIVEACAVYDDLADADGIVCLSPAQGEISAADRLRSVLTRAYGDEWSAATERRLLGATNPTGRAPRSLELWLRDRFFLEHCKLFHNRPLIWHIWDGRKDGFHALVNYRRLAGPGGEGRRTLESLAYAYLNDWIHRQRAEQQAGTAGSDARIEHALDLQQQLERVLEGEPPCDVFVRWKPLHAQANGWDSDLDDGVRPEHPSLHARRTAKGRARRGRDPSMETQRQMGKGQGEGARGAPTARGVPVVLGLSGGRERDGADGLRGGGGRAV